MDERTEVIQAEVPVTLKRRVKAVAALRGMTLREAVAEAILSWCQDRPEYPPAVPGAGIGGGGSVMTGGATGGGGGLPSTGSGAGGGVVG